MIRSEYRLEVLRLFLLEERLFCWILWRFKLFSKTRRAEASEVFRINVIPLFMRSVTMNMKNQKHYRVSLPFPLPLMLL